MNILSDCFKRVVALNSKSGSTAAAPAFISYHYYTVPATLLKQFVSYFVLTVSHTSVAFSGDLRYSHSCTDCVARLSLSNRLAARCYFVYFIWRPWNTCSDGIDALGSFAWGTFIHVSRLRSAAIFSTYFCLARSCNVSVFGISSISDKD